MMNSIPVKQLFKDHFKTDSRLFQKHYKISAYPFYDHCKDSGWYKVVEYFMDVFLDIEYIKDFHELKASKTKHTLKTTDTSNISF